MDKKAQPVAEVQSRTECGYNNFIGYYCSSRGSRMVAARRSFAQIASLWVLLATICAHALSPSPAGLARSSGSAFSYHTADVSLGPKRIVLVDKAKRYEIPVNADPLLAALPAKSAPVMRPALEDRPAPQWQLAAMPVRQSPALEPYAPRAPPIPLLRQ